MSVDEVRRVPFRAPLDVLRDFRPEWKSRLPVIVLAAAVAFAVFCDHAVEHYLPSFAIVLPILVAVGLVNARYTAAETPVVRLLQLLGVTSTLFAFFHYPLMPVSPAIRSAAAANSLIWLVWVGCLAAGLACWRRPSLGLLPAAYLVWSEKFSPQISGLPGPAGLDVFPLAAITFCIGAGLAATRLYRIWAAARLPDRLRQSGAELAASLDDFSQLLVFLALSIHLANYFWSAEAKMTLKGPLFSWVLHNDPAYLFLAALQDHRIAFANHPALVSFSFLALTKTYLFTNAGILLIQALGLVAFFAPRRLILLLLLAYDAMHFGILFSGGLYFWPWIFLNLILGYVVSRHDFARAGLLHKSIGVVFVLCAPILFSVAKLGWFDTGANNNAYIEAVDDRGAVYPVSTNVFTFYSYPIAHMDYGMPQPQTGFITGIPYGSGANYSQFTAGRSCNAAELIRPGSGLPTPLDPRLLQYLAGYNAVLIRLQKTAPWFPYNFNLYHFYTPSFYGAEFAHLDKTRVKAYIVRRESACLSYSDGRLQQKLLSVGEARVDVK